MKTKLSVLVPMTVVFCVALVVSNIIAGKLWLTGLPAPFNIVTAAVILFPIVYIIGDVLPEVYGLEVARKVIFIGFGANLFAVIFFAITLAMAAPAFWANQSAFEVVLGFTPRLLVASFIGYLVGTNANALVLIVIKKLTAGRWLWMRTIGSTLVGETLDSILFVSVAFIGILPPEAIVPMILTQATLKILYEILATPLTYAVVKWAKQREAAGQGVNSLVNDNR